MIDTDPISRCLHAMTWLDWAFAALVLLVCLFCVAIFIGSVQVSRGLRPWWLWQCRYYLIEPHRPDEPVMWLARTDRRLVDIASIPAFAWKVWESTATEFFWYDVATYIHALDTAAASGLQLRRKWL